MPPWLRPLPCHADRCEEIRSRGASSVSATDPCAPYTPTADWFRNTLGLRATCDIAWTIASVASTRLLRMAAFRCVGPSSSVQRCPRQVDDDIGAVEHGQVCPCDLVRVSRSTGDDRDMIAIRAQRSAPTPEIPFPAMTAFTRPRPRAREPRLRQR